MSQEPANGFELRRRALHSRRELNATEGTSRALLLFYCVECAMKALYLRNQCGGAQAWSDQLGESEGFPFGRSGHDLARATKALRVPKSIFGASKPALKIHQRNRNGRRDDALTTVGMDKVHQIWRYGIPHEGCDAALDWLTRLDAWLTAKETL